MGLVEWTATGQALWRRDTTSPVCCAQVSCPPGEALSAGSSWHLPNMHAMWCYMLLVCSLWLPNSGWVYNKLVAASTGAGSASYQCCGRVEHCNDGTTPASLKVVVYTAWGISVWTSGLWLCACGWPVCGRQACGCVRAGDQCVDGRPVAVCVRVTSVWTSGLWLCACGWPVCGRQACGCVRAGDQCVDVRPVAVCVRVTSVWTSGLWLCACGWPVCGRQACGCVRAGDQCVDVRPVAVCVRVTSVWTSGLWLCACGWPVCNDRGLHTDVCWACAQCNSCYSVIYRSVEVWVHSLIHSST